MSSLNDCIKIQHHIKGTSIIFSDYSEKIDDKSQKVLIADLFRTLFYCYSTNLKHDGHYFSNVRFITTNASKL